MRRAAARATRARANASGLFSAMAASPSCTSVSSTDRVMARWRAVAGLGQVSWQQGRSLPSPPSTGTTTSPLAAPAEVAALFRVRERERATRGGGLSGGGGVARGHQVLSAWDGSNTRSYQRSADSNWQ